MWLYSAKLLLFQTPIASLLKTCKTLNLAEQLEQVPVVRCSGCLGFRMRLWGWYGSLSALVARLPLHGQEYTVNM